MPFCVTKRGEEICTLNSNEVHVLFLIEGFSPFQDVFIAHKQQKTLHVYLSFFRRYQLRQNYIRFIQIFSQFPKSSKYFLFSLSPHESENMLVPMC